MSLPTFAATRYLLPLREGGSLPAVVDTQDGGRFVVKFRGAGQGAKALVAEVIVARLAVALELSVPELALVEIGAEFGRAEPDPEIQDILTASRGLNLGMRYLEGALNYDTQAAGGLVETRMAEDLVWLDALTTNPDRSAKNPNLMVSDGRVWAIDHGAALYAHHAWAKVDELRTRSPFAAIASHVLLGQAKDLRAADQRNRERLGEAVLRDALAKIPSAWLMDDVGGLEFASAELARERYLSYLLMRLEEPRSFVDEAVRAQAKLANTPPQRLSSRR